MSENKTVKTIVTKTTTVETITTEVIDSSGNVISKEIVTTSDMKPVQQTDNNGKNQPVKEPVQQNANTTKNEADTKLVQQTDGSYKFDFSKCIFPKVSTSNQQAKPAIDTHTNEYKQKMLEQIRLLNTLITKCKEHMPKNMLSKGIQASNNNASLSFNCTFEVNEFIYKIDGGHSIYSPTTIHVNLTKDNPLHDIVSKLDSKLIYSLRLTELDSKSRTLVQQLSEKYKHVEQYHVERDDANNWGTYLPFSDPSDKYNSLEEFVNKAISRKAERVEHRKLSSKLFPIQKRETWYNSSGSSDNESKQNCKIYMLDEVTCITNWIERGWNDRGMINPSFPVLYLYLNALEPIPETILNRKLVSFTITDMRVQTCKDLDKKEHVIAVPKFTFTVE